MAQGQQLGEAVFDKVRGIESSSASKESKRIWCEGVIGLAHHGDCYEPLFTSFHELLPQCEWEMRLAMAETSVRSLKLQPDHVSVLAFVEFLVNFQ